MAKSWRLWSRSDQSLFGGMASTQWATLEHASWTGLPSQTFILCTKLEVKFNFELKVPYSGWQRPYSLDLTSLPRGHVQEVRVTAIDHNFDTAFVSPSVTIQSSPQCSPPKTPPRNIQVTTIGPTQIRLSWQPLAEPEWNCDNVWYVVKYSSPESQGTECTFFKQYSCVYRYLGYKNLTRGETQVVFDSKPVSRWNLFRIGLWWFNYAYADILIYLFY